MKSEQTSVVICGAGPAGLTLAHLLGQQQVDVILVERLSETVAEPRAIALDGESLRTLQQIGMLDDFKGELLQGLTVNYENGEGVELFSIGSPERKPYGYSTVNSFDQPALDRHLAAGLSALSSVSLRFNTTLESFEQNSTGVRVQCLDENGAALAIEADYLIGADGGRSTIRSLLNIKMVGESNPQPWLVIDTVDPCLEGQLDCHFFCDPERPGMTMRKQHGERRWEWMVMPGENREDLLKDEVIHSIISPYTDVDRVDIYRKRVYDFHAIIAERWQEGRVFLVGDAAHMTPPFAGQGLNSGLRDVANLSWKLSAVVQHDADPAILESYELERKGHAKELIETALNLGKQIQPIDVKEAQERDALFAELNKDPAAMKALEEEMFQSLLSRSVAGGLVAGDAETDGVGQLLTQPRVNSANDQEQLLDELLGEGFAIIGVDCNPEDLVDDELLSSWKTIGATFLHFASDPKQTGVVRLIAEDQELPEWMSQNVPRVVLLRPDRFCMLATNPDEAQAKLRECLSMLFDRTPLASNTQATG